MAQGRFPVLHSYLLLTRVPFLVLDFSSYPLGINILRHLLVSKKCWLWGFSSQNSIAHWLKYIVQFDWFLQFYLLLVQELPFSVFDIYFFGPLRKCNLASFYQKPKNGLVLHCVQVFVRVFFLKSFLFCWSGFGLGKCNQA